MNLLKYHKKFVALLAIFSFLFFMELSSLPLGAEPAPASVSGDDLIPGSLEQEGDSGLLHHKKIPIIPILIGVVAVGAIAAVLLLVVFKATYDLRGDWCITWQWLAGDDAGTQGPIEITFSGIDRKAGTLNSYFISPFLWTGGNWTLTDKKVYWTFANFVDFTWTGEFSDKNRMSGTMVWRTFNDVGTWTAIRSITTTASGAGQDKHKK